MKWCVIGAGGIADRRTIPALISDPSNQLLAVMDKNPAIAKVVGEKYGVPYYSDEAEMLGATDAEAVYISTPVFCHYEQAMLALSYHKHVFLEKPIGLNGEESRRLVQAFRAAGKQLSVGYMMKYHSLHEKAKELIAADGIGQVNSVRAQFTCWYPDIEGAWRQKKSLGGGGAIMDLGVHCLELIEDLLGEEIVDVKGFYSTRTFSYEVEDGAVIILRSKSGILGHVDCNFNIPDKASESKLELYGSKGYILCRGTLAQEDAGTLSHLYAPQEDYEAAQNRTTDIAVEYKGAGDNLYRKQLAAFVKTVESGRLDDSLTLRALRVQELVDRIYAGN
ncbi:MAG: Gfo/Idh/MocA family oxidoreductase [Ruminococcaceae bacterium]|nr:Gfo/Idh/MocA family oxidoreductase [Oscillospiraceae bacterium]